MYYLTRLIVKVLPWMTFNTLTGVRAIIYYRR
jgi:hypothetical protein